MEVCFGIIMSRVHPKDLLLRVSTPEVGTCDINQKRRALARQNPHYFTSLLRWIQCRDQLFSFLSFRFPIPAITEPGRGVSAALRPPCYFSESAYQAPLVLLTSKVAGYVA